MSELDLETVTSQYFDVLKELGNIGAGNAMTALSQMIGSKIDMRVPQVKLLDFNELGGMIGGEEQIMVGVFLGVEGDITGSMLFLLELSSAKHLINKVMMGMGDPNSDELTDMERSAMQEVGNIITGAYLNALSSLTNLKIYPSPPQLAIDYAGALLSVPAAEFGILGDNILLIQTKFSDDVDLDGYFILIPDMESYQKILHALGVM